MSKQEKKIEEVLARGQATQAGADQVIDAATIKAKNDDDAAGYAKLEPLVKRWREKQRSRVEEWKDHLALRVLNETPDQHHEDLLDAMLEIAIDSKIECLGDEIAIDVINLVVKRRIKTLRGQLN